MKNGKLEKKDINPEVAKFTYAKITKLFGDEAEHVAKLMGVKKPSKKKKATEDGEGK